jgi:uncharacterized membrane protein YbhN (UPF0104 family)
MADRARFGSRDLVRVWSSAPGAQLLRRPTDVLLLLIAVLLLAALAVPMPGPTQADDAVVGLLDSLPSAVGLLWGVSTTVLTVWSIVLVLLPLAFRGRRRLTPMLLLAVAVAVGGVLITDASARLALTTAVIVTASPYVSRPLRYWGRLLILAGSVSVVGTGEALPIVALAGLLVGIGAAALTHLVLGSPQGLLTDGQVEIALADLGVDVVDIQEAEDLEPGEALWRARRADGDNVRVKVYGRDAWDSQVVGSLWATITRRGEIPTLGRGRESRVEHEALATLLAERAGAAVTALVAAGRSGKGDAVIVTAAPRVTLRALPVDDVTDDLLDQTWRALAAVHAAGMAHGRIDARHVVVRPDGTAALADFADAVLQASQADIRTDRTRLLVTTAILVGQERALAAALRVIGPDGVVDLLPFLQPAALGRVTRQDLAEEEWTLAELRAAAVEALGVPAPPLQQIRRVTWKSVAIVALIALIAYTLISTFSGVDLQSVVDAMAGASVGLLVLALALSPTIQTGFAVATFGSTMRKLTFLPVLMLQYGVSFISLVLPSTAAKIALEVRFFQSFGVPAASAVGMGMIDSFSGFVVQILLFVVILASGLPAFSGSLGSGSSDDTSSPDSSSDPSLAGIVLALSVIAALVTLLVPRLRRRLLGGIPRMRATLQEQWRNAGDSLQVLRRPRKVATMLAGNLIAQVLQAIVLGVTLSAFGETAALSQLILINTAVSLFVGLMPVPGGMGVAEAGYAAGLQAIGIPAPIAIGVAVAYRLVTFYLPPLWGSLAMRWLRRHEYV